ncbi:MAG: hypothetical protein JKY51_06930 [Opitutaceae bacterium]|nr:hypothetical protein [Opitutaceae bacterium]
MNWKSLNELGKDRTIIFYQRCMQYGHCLWKKGFAARSILCLDRAFGAHLSGEEAFLKQWTLPYKALVWILETTHSTVFLGNTRVHFQHLADRLGEPRKAQRSGRAWACWLLTRKVLPELPSDPQHMVSEPTEDEIIKQLHQNGIPGEVEIWQDAIEYATSLSIRSKTP